MISHGAVTAVNAIPCGMGAAVGIELDTKAEFTERGNERRVTITNDPGEDTKMAEICVRRTYEHFGKDEPDGWSLSVDSRIPVSKGLKSSSSACNAIISAVAEHIRGEYGTGFERNGGGTMNMIRLGVGCAKEANVTVTGAFDDACACHLGGLVITDNTKNRIISHSDAGENDALILVPKEKIRKSSLRRNEFEMLADASRRLIKIAETDWYGALTENGRMISSVLGIDDRAAKDALKLGALAAGVSGTGPAIAIILEKGDGRSFMKDMNRNGYDTILTRTR